MSRRATRRLLAGVAVAAAVAIPAAVLPHAAGSPYDHRWRITSEVGGDIGGRSDTSVTEASVAMKAEAGAYSGSVSYGDRLVVQDPQGGVLVQVSTIGLDLTGFPAGGGNAAGGMFEGTARLDDYLGLTWEQATSGELPDRPTRSATYAVAGRWGAYLSGSTADGELLFETATLRARAGAVDVRDASWFNRFGSGRAQRFEVTVEGAVASGGTGAGTTTTGGGAGTADYVRAGLTGDAGAGSLAAVPLEAALSARSLRDAKLKGGASLPADSVCIDLDVSGLLLDAKNRAAGQRPDSDAGKRAARTWRASREATAIVSGEATGAALARLLREQAKVAGAIELAAQAAAAEAPAGTSENAAMMGERFVTALAVRGTGPSVLAATARAASAVRDTAIPRSGALADGLLADADSRSAPASSLEIERFERRKADDVPFVLRGKRVVGGSGLLRRVLASAPLKDGAPQVSYVSARGSSSIAPEAWLGYRRADDVAFWLADANGPAALRDGTLSGWAYTARFARLVSSSRCGQTLAILRDGEPHASTAK